MALDQPVGELPESVRADATRLLEVIEALPYYQSLSRGFGVRRPGYIDENRAFRVGGDLEFELEPGAGLAPEVAGFGFFRLDVAGGPRSAIVSYREELRGRAVAIEESGALLDALGPIREQLQSDPIVVGLAPPSLQAGCGSTLWADAKGSSGPMVQRAGVTGILTAGHVATMVGTTAYLDGLEWGKVSFTTNGTLDPADVAFVERSTEARGPLNTPRCPQPTLTIRPALGAKVNGCGAMTCRTGNVMGILPFQWFPALGRNLGEIMLTAQAISVPGDSGGLVTDEESGAMVGLIVGSDQQAQTYTSVQLADFALTSAGCTL